MARINPSNPLESIDIGERTLPRTKLGRTKQILYGIGEDYEDPRVIWKYLRNMTARSGGGFVVSRRQNGLLWSWGCSASEGQLGTGLGDPTTTPAQISVADVYFSRVLATGKGHTIALDVSGAPFTWGDNTYGQLGDGYTISRSVPSATKGNNIVGQAVAAGNYHSLLIDEDDTFLWTWGLNTSGQLGDGTTTDRLSPVSIALETGRYFRKIDAGDNFSLALDQRNQAWTWGDNQYGQLGLGVGQAGGNDIDTLLLLNCDGADGHTTFTDTSSGGNHGTATVVGGVEGDTAYKVWGTASLLNPGGTSNSIYFADDSDWDVATFTDYTIDFWVRHNSPTGFEYYMSQYLNDSNTWYFGNEPVGVQHGLFFGMWISASNQVFMQTDGSEITDTDWHHLAMCKVGTDWGIYKDGQQVCYTSDSYSGSINAPLYISWGRLLSQPHSVNGNMDEIRIRGDNYFGAAPNSGKTDTIEVPTGPYGTGGGTSQATSPLPVVGNKDFIEIAAGSQSGHGIDETGIVWGWGNNTAGQLGDNTTTTTSGAPVSVTGRHSFIQITAGGVGSNGHTCGLKADGTVWCWGKNHHGQAGSCDYADKSSPVAVTGRHSFIDVWAAKNAYATLAIKADGSVWVWGQNPFCDTSDYCSPVSIPDFNLITLNILGRGYLEDHSTYLEY